MKSFLRYALVALALCLLPVGAQAASCSTTAYARTAGNWSGTSTFSTASPGGSSCTLAAGNAVVFDANTGTGNYPIDSSISIASLDTTNAPASTTITHNTGTTLTVSGATFYLATNVTYTTTATRAINFTSTSGTTTVTTNGQTLGLVTFNGVGGTWTLAGGTFSVSGVLTVTAGTLDANTNSISVNAPNVSVATGGTVNCGSGTWTLSLNTGTVWTSAGSASLSCASSTITFSAATNGGGRVFTLLNGQSFGTINVSNAGATIPSIFSFSITTGATIATLNFTNLSAGIDVYLTGNTALTLSNAPSWAGSSGNFITFIGSSPNTGFITFALPSSAPITPSWVAFSNVKFTGSSSTVTATNSLDLSGNNNMNGGSISAPSFGGGGGHIIGG
jgi:hypothetical protein